ncbi:helix-turn-helix transcriptional regulator [Saccharothrix yanglingensis]|uniref:Helix-turn-helix transcriptional regulator n=1 Tax=Saccharothrix yanglingensis TaxID=659496 RepID=A0ABU0X8H6_9PSEU|nr:helix-turn-helix transcriptional regulator [Saccharothrix yanglingensis]
MRGPRIERNGDAVRPAATLPSLRPTNRPANHRAHHDTRHADAFRSLFERSGTCMAVVDPMLRIHEVNKQFLREVPLSDSPVGRTLLDFVPPADHVRLRRQFTQLALGRRERLVERVTWLWPGTCDTGGTMTAVAGHSEAVPGEAPVSTIVVSVTWNEGPIDEGPGQEFRLTELDARILEGIATGMSTINLATKLYLSRQGVEYHVGSMLKKLDAPNRAALVSRAFSLGVLRSMSWPPRVDAAFVK